MAPTPVNFALFTEKIACDKCRARETSEKECDNDFEKLKTQIFDIISVIYKKNKCFLLKYVKMIIPII